MGGVGGGLLQKQVNQSYGSCVLYTLLWCFTFVRNFMKISRTVFNSQSGHQYTVEMAIFNFYNVQRAVTPKVG